MAAIASKISLHLMYMKYDAELLEATSIVIRRLRIEAGLSQEGLAEKSGLSRSMLDRSERRERLPSLDVLIKIASALNKSASEVVAQIEEQLKK